ncbi:MAG: hypothetical protein AAGA34_03090 [Pseudomonadota bacterium]
MIVGTWSPASQGAESASEELLVSFDQSRAHRVLILPALFNEANALRRFTLSVMRALDASGVDSALPDLAGMNESLVPMRDQSLTRWRTQLGGLVESFGATQVLAMRGGAMLAPASLPGWRYAALDGPKLLATLLRARVVDAREAGRSETREALLEEGRVMGLRLAGWDFGAKMVCELENEQLALASSHRAIDQSRLGGPGLWLRAEPDEDEDQARALADIVIADIGDAADPSS